MGIRGGVVPEKMVSNLRIRFSGEWLVRLDGESTVERTTYAYLYVLINTTLKITPPAHAGTLFSG